VDLLTIKGLKGGTTFFLSDHAPLPEVTAALQEELERSGGFFRDSQVILHFGARLLTKEEWRALKEVLHAGGLILRYAVALSADSRDVLYKEGVPVREETAEAPAGRRRPKEGDGGERAALYLRRNLRSGQKEVSDRDVVVVGDVNQGAEILAAGDVVVFGSLRGVVHAGYPDHTDAVVISLRLVPLQLRIGPLIARPEEDERGRRAPRPEVGRVQGDRIVIEPFTGKV